MLAVNLILIIGYIIGTAEWYLVLTLCHKKYAEWKYIGYDAEERWKGTMRILYHPVMLIIRGVLGILIFSCKLASDPTQGWRIIFARGYTPLSKILVSAVDYVTALLTKSPVMENGSGLVYTLASPMDLIDFSVGIPIGPIHLNLVSILTCVWLPFVLFFGMSLLAFAFMPEIILAATLGIFIYLKETYRLSQKICDNRTVEMWIADKKRDKEIKKDQIERNARNEIRKANTRMKEARKKYDAQSKLGKVPKREPLAETTGRWQDAINPYVGHFYNASTLEIAGLAISAKDGTEGIYEVSRDTFVTYPMDAIDGLMEDLEQRADVRNAQMHSETEREEYERKQLRHEYNRGDKGFGVSGTMLLGILQIALGAICIYVLGYSYMSSGLKTHFWRDFMGVFAISTTLIGGLIFLCIKSLILRGFKKLRVSLKDYAWNWKMSARNARKASDLRTDFRSSLRYIRGYSSKVREDNENVSCRLSELYLLKLLSDPDKNIKIYASDKNPNTFYFIDGDGKLFIDRHLQEGGVRGELRYPTQHVSATGEFCGSIKIDLLQQLIIVE